MGAHKSSHVYRYIFRPWSSETSLWDLLTHAQHLNPSGNQTPALHVVSGNSNRSVVLSNLIVGLSNYQQTEQNNMLFWKSFLQQWEQLYYFK